MEKNGILTFITNRSFIDSRTFDGFRKIIASEFNAVHIIDLGGDVRANPKISGTKHNVFGIQTGVAIMILVRKESNFKLPLTRKEFKELKADLNIINDPVVLYKEKEYFSTQGCRIYYLRRPEMETAKEKLEFLHNSKIEYLVFDHLTPDKNNNWINLSEDNDWESLIPLATKDVKLGRSKEAVFELFSLGVITARDEWVYDEQKGDLTKKIKFLISIYNSEVDRLNGKSKEEIKNEVDHQIKWTREVKNDLSKGRKYSFKPELIIDSLYRPFIKKKLYFSNELNEMQYLMKQVFGDHGIKKNKTIYISGTSSSKQFSVLSLNLIGGLDLIEKTQCLPLFRYDKEGNRQENLTDWGLKQFVSQYQDKKITKEDIFHYTYAVLHNPAYRKKYDLNLKREFPRLPFYEDFYKWATWGKTLMDLHINYETVNPWPLERHDFDVKAEAKRQKEIFSKAEEPEGIYSRQPRVKVKLKADKTTGIIVIDELTFLRGVPKEAWEYNLGNRSAIEWVLDQYKEKKPKDPTIAEKFYTYKFADYKEQVIDLLKRVCTVSFETVKIIKQMELEK